MTNINHRGRTLGSDLIVAALVSFSLCAVPIAAAIAPAQAAGNVTLSETGSTLLYPLF
jgi:hypothetical protein